MALDGVVLSNVVYDLKNTILNGKIDKINQPEKDELIFNIRSNRKNHKLLLTAEASNPRVHFTTVQKTNPMTPPSLCMLFRKHLVGGKIIEITQPGLDRVIHFTIEHYDEMNDLARKHLIVEIMGRHSNIILTDSDYLILESVKRVSAAMSSLREVFPGRTYVKPPAGEKTDFRTVETLQDFIGHLDKKLQIQPALYKSFYGISATLSESVCYNAGINGSTYIEEMSDSDFDAIYFEMQELKRAIAEGDYKPTIYIEDNTYSDFHSTGLSHMASFETRTPETISVLLDDYYKTRANQVRMKQKSVDLRKLVQTLLDRNTKKLSLQQKQLKDTKDKDKFKIKGELIQANLYQIEEGAKSIEVLNYYTNEMVKITLKENLTAVQNANKFFDKYNKKKRTEIAVVEQIESTKREIMHLESVQYSLDNAELATDIEAIRKELMDAGYIKYKSTHKKDKRMKPSKPLHFLSKDGFHIYVGRNNEQNEFLSTKFAHNSDWWFHTKEVPGSHVIVVTKGKELPDETYEEAAALAAYYSKAKDSTKVTVDYVQAKFIKKPPATPLGFVIYNTNYSLHIAPSKGNLEEIQ